MTNWYVRSVPTLDVVPLRSLVAVASFAGVRRAAQALNLSHAAVSGHLRRLEREIGRPLVVRDGRMVTFTADGHELVIRARQLLDVHDAAVAAIAGDEVGTIRLASTEHAADALVPEVTSLLSAFFPDTPVRVRLTRSEWARQLFAEDRADVAIYLTRPRDASILLGHVGVDWFGAPGADPNEVVVFAEPCAVRSRALGSRVGDRIRVAHVGNDLNDVLAAARAGLGITPLPRLGPIPDGLGIRSDLPPITSVPLYLAVADSVDDALRDVLTSRLAAFAGVQF